ncbi:MAG: MBL fold metallo-hydrolase [Anaerolineales bacterium]
MSHAHTVRSRAKLPPIERYHTDNGARIYRMPLEAFPKFIVYSYLVLQGGAPTLIDTGSNMDRSHDDLIDAIHAVRDQFDEPLEIEDIGRIIISHGHIDHHGGLNHIRGLTGAEVGIHALDKRVIQNYQERVVVATKNLRIFLQRAGVEPAEIEALMGIYGFAKRMFKAERVDFLLEEDTDIDGMTFIHTPGHCPGQVCIRIGDVLLTADHVLSRITPHQAPESITHYTGLGHYLTALDKISHVEGITLALGGHEDPIYDFYDRLDAIHADHQRKLDQILGIFGAAGAPLTIQQVTQHMYPNQSGYNVLLAIEEAGAHVEYLYEHGYLAVANLDEVEAHDNPALQYHPA